MDFKFNEEQKMLRQLARDFAGDEIAPLVDAAEREGHFPKELLPKVGKLGFLDPDLDVVSHCIICEEMCKVSMGIWDTPVTILMASSAIARHGSEYLKQKYLPAVSRGEMVICFALTDVTGGSDIGGMESTARRDGDSYILNGNKTLISMAPYSDTALVIANMDRSKRTKGLTMFIVDKETPGFSVSRNIEKMGMHSSLYGEIVLEDCRIPKENLVGKEMGFMQIQESLAIERTLVAAEVLGICEAAFESALDYSKEREAFGRPIGKFQGISFKVVDMAIAIEAVRWLTYWSAWLWDQGEKPFKEAAMVKHFAVEAGCQVTDLAMRIFGGYGYCKDLPIERYFRDVRGLLFGDGTQEIQKVFIAKALGL